MTDTLVATKRLVSLLKENKDMAKAMNILKNEMLGSYCFTFLTDKNTIYAARDPRGFRPLVLGYHKETQSYIVASESCALSSIGAILKRDVDPGELLKMDKLLKDFLNRPHMHIALLNLPILHILALLWKE